MRLVKTVAALGLTIVAALATTGSATAGDSYFFENNTQRWGSNYHVFSTRHSAVTDWMWHSSWWIAA